MGALVKQALLDEGVSVGHAELKNKRRRQVWGVGIMLASSTLLLVNVTAFIMFPEKLNGTWLNVFVGGFNLDSILFNVGVMLVCGGGVKRVAAGDQAKEKQAAAQASYVPNSGASSVYHPSEVGGGETDHKSTCSLQPVLELGQENDRESGQGPGEETATSVVLGAPCCASVVQTAVANGD